MFFRDGTIEQLNKNELKTLNANFKELHKIDHKTGKPSKIQLFYTLVRDFSDVRTQELVLDQGNLLQGIDKKAGRRELPLVYLFSLLSIVNQIIPNCSLFILFFPKKYFLQTIMWPILFVKNWFCFKFK
jgi:hypothetical protein